jgi:hypothetical protein
VVEKHVSVLDTCRDSRKAPVDMRFLVTFEADGRPATRLVANNLFDCTFAECVRERLDGLDFEAFTGRPSEQYYLGLSWRGNRPPVVGLNRPLGDKPTERYCVEERHAKENKPKAESAGKTSPPSTPSGEPLAPNSEASMPSVEPSIASVEPSAASSSAVARSGKREVSRRLPPEVIQKVVRSGFANVGVCYDQGVARDPDLAGHIAIRFVIDLDGTTIDARVASNTLRDCGVAQCVANSFLKLRFPKPDKGKVTIVYPISFSP